MISQYYEVVYRINQVLTGENEGVRVTHTLQAVYPATAAARSIAALLSAERFDSPFFRPPAPKKKNKNTSNTVNFANNEIKNQNGFLFALQVFINTKSVIIPATNGMTTAAIWGHCKTWNIIASARTLNGMLAVIAASV